MRTNLRVTLLLAVTVVVACKTETRPSLGQSVTRGWFTELRSSRGADVSLLEDGDLQTSIPAAEMGALELRWDTSVRALALAVHSPTAAVVEVHGNKEPVELEQGWNILPIAERTQATTLKWVQDSELSEVQLLVEGSMAPWMDAEVLLGAGVPDPGTRIMTPSPDHGSLDPGQASCRTFEFQVPIPPSGLQRAVVGLDVTHAWGVFSLGRALNDAPMMEALGTALEADGQRRAVTAELPVQQLKRGGNVLRLCADGWSRHSIQLEHVRVALELARGSVQSPFPKEPARLVLDGRQDSTTVLPVQLELRETVMVGAVEVIHHGAASGLRVMRGTQEVPVARREEIEGGTALFLARPQNTWAGALTVAGEGAVAEVRVLGLPTGPGLVGRPRVDFPLAGQLVGPYAVVTGTLPVAGANGLVTLTGAGMANGSGVLREGWFAVSALRTTLDNGSYPAELTVTTDQGEEWVIALDFQADLTRTVGPGGRATTSLPVDEERDRFGLVGGPPARGTVTAEAGGSIKLGSDVLVRFPKGAVAEATEVSIQRMSELAIHPLNPGMINVTAPGGALYRFEPSPRQFQEKVTVTLPYDPNLVPPNVPSSEIRTYYFDLAEQKYVPLETLDVDESRSVVLALTDHFTDMINAVLMQPESPTPQSFNPNAISGLAAADPTTGMTLVAPPEARADGSAGITYPFPLPKARGRFQPQLALTYNSQGGMGQAGWGWSLTTSSIEVDTRYGAPEYAAPGSGRPGERYTWDGQQLVPTDTTLSCSTGENGRQFRLRREGRFARIVRCGDGPTTYFWEVTEKEGTRFVYGRREDARLDKRAALFDPTARAPIGKWMLEDVTDVDGNVCRYEYLRRTEGVLLVFQVQELERVLYGMNPSAGITSPPYKVILGYRGPRDVQAGDTPDDDATEAALGFPVLKAHRLTSVQVQCASGSCGAGQLVGEYALNYAQPGPSTLHRSLLSSVDAWGALGRGGGGDVHTTTFSYEPAPGDNEFAFGEADGTTTDWGLPTPDALPLQSSTAQTKTGDGAAKVSLGFAAANNLRGPGAGANLAMSIGAATPHSTMVDLNGDGLLDRLVSTEMPGLREEVPGAGWLAGELFGQATGGAPFTRVYLNNGTDFVEVQPIPSDPGLASLTNAPLIGHDLTGGFGVGVDFGGGLDAVRIQTAMGGQGGLQVTTDTLMDLDGDGLVDEVGASPRVQRRRSGAITFEANNDAPGAGCLDLNAAPPNAATEDGAAPGVAQSTMWDLVKDVAATSESREAVLRWRAPHDGVIDVSASYEALASCSQDTEPPTVTMTVIATPPTSSAEQLPVPRIFGGPDGGPKPPSSFNVGGQEYALRPEVAAGLVVAGLARYRALGQPAVPVQSSVLTGGNVPNQTQGMQVKRGAELHFHVKAGGSCNEEALGGLTDAVRLQVHVEYTASSCAADSCATPVTRTPGKFDSAGDFRVGAVAGPLQVKDAAPRGDIQGLLYVNSPADVVTFQIRRVRCGLQSALNAVPGAFNTASQREDFPFAGFSNDTVVRPAFLQAGTPLDDLDTPRAVLKALDVCQSEPVRLTVDGVESDSLTFGPETVDTLAVTASILDVLPGDVVLAEAIGASTIDPATVVAGPFKLTWSQRQHVQPGLVGPTTVPTDDASGRDVRLPVHIGWRKLTPRDGRYKMITRTTEPVEVKLLVPPTWLLGGDRPVLVVQQEGRVERISLEPPQLLGVCPGQPAVCELWCVPPGCENACGKPSCFSYTGPVPSLPNPQVTIQLGGSGQHPLDNGNLFLSLEPPPSVVTMATLPEPWDLEGHLRLLKTWADPVAGAFLLAQWWDWAAFAHSLTLQEAAPILGERLLSVRVGNRPADSSIVVMEPEGTYGTPLPLPMPTLTGRGVVEGFKGWGYGEYVSPAANEPRERDGEQPSPFSGPFSDWWVSPQAVGAMVMGDPNGPLLAMANVRNLTLAVASGWVSRMQGAVSSSTTALAGMSSPTPDVDPLTENLRAATGDILALPYQVLGVRRLTPMLPYAGRYQGSCRNVVFDGTVMQGGHCAPGDVTLPEGVPTRLGQASETLKRVLGALRCPRPVPRITANAGLSSAMSVSVVGLRTNAGMSGTVLDYRDVTGDGLPDTILVTSVGLVVIKGGRPLPGTRPAVPLLTGGVLPPQTSLSFAVAPNASGSIPTGLGRANSGQGRGQATSANGTVANGHEGLIANPAVSGEANLQVDVSLLVDANGDGLADLVRTGASGCSGFLVRPNVGGRFLAPYCIEGVTEDGGRDEQPILLGLGVSLGVSGSVNLAASSQKGDEAGTSQSVSISRHNQHLQFVDVNGDGLPDLVSMVQRGTIGVRFNLGRTLSPLVRFAAASLAIGTGFTLPTGHEVNLDLRSNAVLA